MLRAMYKYITSHWHPPSLVVATASIIGVHISRSNFHGTVMFVCKLMTEEVRSTHICDPTFI